jgi:hypothetical protein
MVKWSFMFLLKDDKENAVDAPNEEILRHPEGRAYFCLLPAKTCQILLLSF